MTHWETLQVSKDLGISPMLADRIAGLMNGRINPDNFNSIEPYLLADMAIKQPLKVLTAIASLLGGAPPEDKEGFNVWSVVQDDVDLPTVFYYAGDYHLHSQQELLDLIDKNGGKLAEA